MSEDIENNTAKIEMISTFLAEVRKLNLPADKYAVVGGGALTARGLRKTDDIDLILTKDLYEQLKKEGWEEKEKRPGYFHIYKGKAEAAKDFSHIDGCRLDSNEVIRKSDFIEGVPVMTLSDLIALKQTMGREKDLEDIGLILNKCS